MAERREEVKWLEVWGFAARRRESSILFLIVQWVGFSDKTFHKGFLLT
jgi:hypothetical protein